MGCEAFAKGFAFVTADAKYASQFEIELVRHQMATFVIPNRWLRPSKVSKP
ncbi:hypothetical protein AA313_de0203393 [Arthrobotrys entomopaga]|nr:hypothetical protein AA313_de0203393 [Arthrobotrys entomopaga]